MKATITLEKPYGRKLEITPADMIQIQHDSHSSYSSKQYIDDLMSNFEMTAQEATEEYNKFFHSKK